MLRENMTTNCQLSFEISGGEAPRTLFGTKFVFASMTAWLWRVHRQSRYVSTSEMPSSERQPVDHKADALTTTLLSQITEITTYCVVGLYRSKLQGQDQDHLHSA